MKKKSLLIIVLLLVLTLTIGASYAFWQATHKQESKNVVSIGCFSLESDIGTAGEQSPISLMDAMPITDVEGMNLSPFTFTLTNTCSMYAEYQVNLETLSTTTLNLDYLKVALSNNTPQVLSSYPSVTPTITNANISNKLISGGLRQGEAVTYELRLWLDEDTPRVEGSNKLYNGKISITASPSIDDSGVKTIQNLVKGEPTNTLDVITKEAPDGATCTNTFGYDNTTDNNLRYVGSDPCNYVTFNNEIWRIIGVMNNVDDGSGKKESRLKLIRNESLGNYSWDSSDSSINSGSGVNQWGPSTNYETGEAYPGADLMQELNGDYLDLTLTENTMWYNDFNNGKRNPFDYTKRLNASTQELIDNAIWYTGAANDTSILHSDMTPTIAYTNERGINPNAINNGKYCSSGSHCTDTIKRTYQWTGKVGLQYPSDTGYATSGSTSNETYTREKCINEGKYSDSSSGCFTASNTWISESVTWTISPYANDNGIYALSNGVAGNKTWNPLMGVRPSLYLKSTVRITGGDGSSTNPYTLGM